MAVNLVIQDGNPWYLSPDIWVVPGSDPNGAIGSPVAGQPAYLWARIANTGNTDAANVRLDYYWADPTLQVTRSNAHVVGSAFATVPAGATREALCIVPWVPVIVNDGHECLVVTATHPSDPLPSPLPDAFDPPAYEQVAQKNLTVLEMSALTLILQLTIGGLPRIDKRVTVDVEVGGELDGAALASLGLKGAKPAGVDLEVGLRRRRRTICKDDSVGERKLEFDVPRQTEAGVQLAVRAKEPLPRRTYQLVTLTERDGDTIIGGTGFVVVAADQEGAS